MIEEGRWGRSLRKVHEKAIFYYVQAALIQCMASGYFNFRNAQRVILRMVYDYDDDDIRRKDPGIAYHIIDVTKFGRRI